MASTIYTAISSKTKQRIVSATIRDVVGSRCAVQLADGGRLLLGLTYSGPSPMIGQLVKVDYSSGSPLVLVPQPLPVSQVISIEESSVPIDQEDPDPSELEEIRIREETGGDLNDDGEEEGQVRVIITGHDTTDEFGVHANIMTFSPSGDLTFYVDGDDGLVYSLLGNIAGWSFDPSRLYTLGAFIDASIPAIGLGGATDYMTGTGFFVGQSSSLYKLHIGNPVGDHVSWDGSNLVIVGSTFTSGVVYAGDGTLPLGGSVDININRTPTYSVRTRPELAIGSVSDVAGFPDFGSGLLTFNRFREGFLGISENDDIGEIRWQSTDDAAMDIAPTINIIGYANQDWYSTGRGSRVELKVTPDDTTTMALVQTWAGNASTFGVNINMNGNDILNVGALAFVGGGIWFNENGQNILMPSDAPTNASSIKFVSSDELINYGSLDGWLESHEDTGDENNIRLYARQVVDRNSYLNLLAKSLDGYNAGIFLDVSIDSEVEGIDPYGSMSLQVFDGEDELYPRTSLFEVVADRINMIVLSSFKLGGNIDNEMIFADSDTGFVGIGTDSPSEKLNVIGNILATGTINGSNTINGSGVAGQVAEWSDTQVLQAAKLIGPTSNILTLTSAAAATLGINISSGKTLTLTAADDYNAAFLGNISFPATGAIGDLLYGSSSSAFSRLADVAAGQPLLSGGVGVAPGYAGYTFAGTAARTYTYPIIDDTLAGLGTANVFTALNTLTNVKLSTGKIYPSSNSTTAIQITKADGTTNILNIDTTNGFVGIGLTTPGFPLEVFGTTTTIDLFVLNNLKLTSGLNAYTSNDNSAFIYRTLNTGAAYPFLEAGNLVIQPRTSLGRDIVFATGATTPTTKMIIDRSGNVGIGITAPTSKLHLVGNQYINTNSSTALLIEQSGVKSNTLRVDTSNGWVGIAGVPAEELSIFGVDAGSANNLAMYLSATSSTAANQISFFRPRGTTASPTINVSDDRIGTFIWRGYDGVAYRQIATIQGRSQTVTGSNDISGALYFNTRPTGSGGALATRMFIGEDGNVLIGTTSNLTNGGKLQVVGSADVVQFILRANGTQTTNNLFEAQNNSGTVQASMTGTGRFGLGIAPGASMFKTQETKTDTSGFLASVLQRLDCTPASSSSATFITSWNRLFTTGSQNLTGSAYGLYNEVIHQSSGVLTYAAALTAGVKLDTGAGNITTADMINIGVQTGTSAASIIGSVRNLRIESPSIGAGSTTTITNLTGISIANMSLGTSTNKAIQTGTGLVIFGDQLAINGSADRQQLIVTGFTTQVVGTSLAQLTRNDAAVGISAMLGLTALGSGASGDGGSVRLAGKSSTTADTTMGLIDYRWITATHASRAAAMRFYAYDTAARLGLEIEASGSVVKLGLFGVSPIVQPANTVAIDTLLVNTGLRASGGIALFDTDVKIGIVGNGLYVKEGSNATMGVATLVLGTVTVNTTKVTANSRIFISVESLGTITSPVGVAVTARVAGTSFTITSANLTDTSVISWLIVEPA